MEFDLKWYNEVLKSELYRVILGDFSWVSIYEKYQSDSKKIITTLGRDFKISNPHSIYQKFLRGDNSWEIDLRNYISTPKRN